MNIMKRLSTFRPFTTNHTIIPTKLNKIPTKPLKFPTNPLKIPTKHIFQEKYSKKVRAKTVLDHFETRIVWKIDRSSISMRCDCDDLFLTFLTQRKY